MRGLLIGRFQPFHLGHRYLIEDIATDVEEVVVGIGSSECSHTECNPFTSGERVHFVKDALDEMDAKTYLIPIDDIEQNALWVRHVEMLCPSFDVVFSNNPFVERLFEEAGYEVSGTSLHNRKKYRGAEIRRRMIADESWDHLVPDPVIEAIEEIGGVERLRAIARDDAPETA